MKNFDKRIERILNKISRKIQRKIIDKINKNINLSYQYQNFDIFEILKIIEENIKNN